jgi:membrane associated rhomboid family serine protease
MIPVADVIPPRTTPWVTLTLVAVNLVTVIIELLMTPEDLREIIYAWGLIPETRSPATFLTSLFLHAGLIQASSNLGALWLFGGNVEDRLGHGRFLLFYVLTGAAGGLAEAIAHAASPFPIVGATGATAGVIGAYFVTFPTSRMLVLVPVLWTLDLIEIPALLVVAFWLLLQAIGADGALVAPMSLGSPPLFAQTCGASVGALAMWLFRRRERMSADWWPVRGRR